MYGSAWSQKTKAVVRAEFCSQAFCPNSCKAIHALLWLPLWLILVSGAGDSKEFTVTILSPVGECKHPVNACPPYHPHYLGGKLFIQNSKVHATQHQLQKTPEGINSYLFIMLVDRFCKRKKKKKKVSKHDKLDRGKSWENVNCIKWNISAGRFYFF